MAHWAGRWAAFALGLALAAGPALAAGGGHAEAGAKKTVFEGGIGNSLVTLLILGFVVWILGKYAWPPLMAALDEREKSIRDSLEKARQEREASERLLHEYEAKLNQARNEATALVEEGRRDGEEVRRRIQEEARVESAAMVERARREIQLATDAAVHELYSRFSEMAIDVARSVVRKELKASDHEALIKDSLARIQGQSAKMN
jgi:F-type H+-transporting ATPase subunit b